MISLSIRRSHGLAAYSYDEEKQTHEWFTKTSRVVIFFYRNIKGVDENSSIYAIELLNKTGDLLKKINLEKAQGAYQINVQSLKPDIYYLRLYNGKTWEVQQVLIQ